HEGGAALLGQIGGDARVLDHCVLLGESLWFQPALRLVSGHPWRPRNHHRFTTDPMRTGEGGGSLCEWRGLARALIARQDGWRTGADAAKPARRPRYSLTKRTAMEPSPTAAAARLTEPLRTSPTANTPGALVSSR